MRRHIAVSSEPLRCGEGEQWLIAEASGAGDSGALVQFSGWVRADQNGSGAKVESLFLEHYPGMTESVLCAIVDQAAEQWPLNGAWVVHRIGALAPGEEIVQVAVSAAHRHAAFAACSFIMDLLKTRAPFWKKELIDGHWRWVDARESDAEAAASWLQQASAHEQ